MSDSPGGNPNSSNSPDRHALSTSFKRTYAELALDFDDDDTRSRGSSSSSAANVSHGRNSERSKRARSESEREATGSATGGTSSTTLDEDVDMSDGDRMSSHPSSLSRVPTDDLTPALTHISSSSPSASSATVGPAPANTRPAELLEEHPLEESFRLSMERYTEFDSNISALRNSVTERSNPVALNEARPAVVDNISSTRNATGGERVADRNGIPSAPASANSSRPVVVVLSDDSDSDGGTDTAQGANYSWFPLRQLPGGTSSTSAMHSAWGSTRGDISGNETSWPPTTSGSRANSVYIDLTRGSERETAPRATASQTGRYSDRPSRDSNWLRNMPRLHPDSFPRTSTSVEGNHSLEGRARAPRRAPRTLLHPSHSLSARSRSVGERPATYPTPLVDHEEAVFLRDAIATLTDRNSAPSRSSHDSGNESRSGQDDAHVSTTSDAAASLRQREREWIIDGILSAEERIGRTPRRSDADTPRQVDVPRAVSPSAWFPRSLADPVTPYAYPWYYPPPAMHPYSRYSMPYPYYPYPPSYYSPYGADGWAYASVPPHPLPPLPVELILGSRSPSTTGTATDRSVHDAPAPNVVVSDPVPRTSSGPYRHDSLSPWFSRGPLPDLPPTPRLPNASSLMDDVPAVEQPLSRLNAGNDAPISPRSRPLQQLPPWINRPTDHADESSSRSSDRASHSVLSSQRVLPSSSPSRSGHAGRGSPSQRPDPSGSSPTLRATPTLPSAAAPAQTQTEVNADLAEIYHLITRSHVVLRRMIDSPRTNPRARELMVGVIDQQHNLLETLRGREGTPREEIQTGTASSATTGQASVAPSNEHESRATVPTPANEVPETQPMEVDSGVNDTESNTPTRSESSSRLWDELGSVADSIIGSPPRHSRSGSYRGTSTAPSWRDLDELDTIGRDRASASGTRASGQRAPPVPLTQTRNTNVSSYRPSAAVTLDSTQRSTAPSRWCQFRDRVTPRSTPTAPNLISSIRSAQTEQGNNDHTPQLLPPSWANILNETISARRPPIPLSVRPNPSTAQESGTGTNQSGTVPTQARGIPPGWPTIISAGGSDVTLPATAAALPRSPFTASTTSSGYRTAPVSSSANRGTPSTSPQMQGTRLSTTTSPRPQSRQYPPSARAESEFLGHSSEVIRNGRSGPVPSQNPDRLRSFNEAFGVEESDDPDDSLTRAVFRANPYLSSSTDILTRTPASSQESSSADAMKIDSASSAAPDNESEVPRSLQTDRNISARVNETSSSSERSATTLEGVGTRTPLARPRNTNFHSRSSGINLAAFSGGPFRDSLARTMALESRRGARATFRAGTLDRSPAGRSSATLLEENRTALLRTADTESTTQGPAGLSPSRSRNSAHGDTQSNEDEIEIRTIPGVSGTAVRRSDLPNDIRSRQEALDRYREEHTRTGRMSNWALPDTHPWEAGPWEAHRIRTLGREHNDSRSNIRRDLLGYPMGSRDGSSRTSRHAARDDSAMYDWAHRTTEMEATYETWFGFPSFTGGSGRGTSDSVVNNLPSGTYGEWATPGETEERCPICFDDYQTNDPVLKLPNCSHWFHKPCLKQWLKNARTCPVCRSRVESGTGQPSSTPSTNPNPNRPYFVVPLNAPHRDRDPAHRRPMIRRRMLPQDLPPLTPTEVPYATLRTPPTGGSFTLLRYSTTVHPPVGPPPTTTGNVITSQTPVADTTATAATNPSASLGPNSSASTQNHGSPRSDTATNNSSNSRTTNNTEPSRYPPDGRWPGDDYRNPWE